MQSVDKGLVVKCKKHDKTALTELFKMYEKYLYKICYTYCQNQQDALDLIQEIYIKIFNNIDKFNEDMSFHPWVRKLSVNTCLNFRRTIKNNVISLNEGYNKDCSVVDIIASDFSVEKEIEKLDIKKIIIENIKSLPENYRLIIILRYYEDLSYNEISELLNKPLGTVKTELYRAKAILKKQLETTWEG